ncbi:hypothetical protein [Ornithinimicrobium pekingense]|uniref:Peptide chain release factor 1 n=1 Tax=Ornithinimicrobium pekingense TaxID=384677 RepID=A0ABQ2F7H3_9MICO|nr:hypothetical protein [Ornithinimicrobium pekingense]GGK68928.1 hypothetical protein GCM10011509_16650 [Ornithinimicrobium pekingense]
MDLMTRAEFEQLVGDGEGTRVSLFAPTHRVGGPKEADADRLRWKNLLAAVEGALLEDGHERRDVEQLLAPARELHGDGMAWSHMGDGLAMYLAPGWSATYRVPLELPELAAVGPGFVLGPVLPLLSDQNYVVLTLSQKHVRVLRGSRDRIGELDVPAVPEAFGDVFEADGPQSDSVPRPNASGRASQGGAVYYGASSTDNVHKEDVVEFFREVSRGVEEHLAGRSIPMILAGLPEWVAVYRELNSYPHLVDAAIEHNPDAMSAEDLRAAAWELVEKRLEQDGARLLDRFHEQRARGTGAAGAEAVATAAEEGRVDTLLMTADGCYTGGLDGPEVVRPLRDGDVCGVVDSAARATLRNGGAVRMLEELPDGAPVAAVLRY